MTTSIWETPWNVSNVSECVFYHAMDLPGVGSVHGDWDMRATIDAYLGPCPLKGRTVLDLGSASGFLSFSAEQRGADVVSFDLRDATRDFTLVPYAYKQHVRSARLTELDSIFVKVKKSYWLAHRLLNSRARVYYGNVYALPEELGQFDVVLLGQILVHLQNPVAALASAAQRARDHLVIVERVDPGEAPFLQFLPQYIDNQSTSWWHWSLGMYRRVLRILGFQIEHVATASHLCHGYGKPTTLELTTITARRCARWQEVPSVEEVHALEALATPGGAHRQPAPCAPPLTDRRGVVRRILQRTLTTLKSARR